jgi:hypothetical protein
LKTQLLCTFAHLNDVNIVTDYIQQNYTIPESRIFIFAAGHNQNTLYCTYNALYSDRRGQNTISIHRKKETNTLYTVNALNEVIVAVNNGVLDKSYQLDWSQFQNSFILTNDAGYRVIELIFHKKVSWN